MSLFLVYNRALVRFRCHAVAVVLLILTTASAFSFAKQPQLQCTAKSQGLNSRSTLVADRDFFSQFIADVEISSSLLPMSDQSCFIKVEDLIKEKNVRAVDVRREESFRSGSLPNAINIQENDISYKVFLKREPIVLIDYGYRYSDLYYLCPALKHDGFRDVKILEGGFSAWQSFNQEKKHHELGKNSAEHIAIDNGEQLKTLSPLEFILAGNKHQWVVLNFTSVTALPKTDNIVTLSSENPLKKTRIMLNSRLKNIETQIGRKPNILILTFSGNSKTISVKELLPKGSLASTYFLEGGKSGYEDYVRNNVLMLAQRRQKQYSLQSGCR